MTLFLATIVRRIGEEAYELLTVLNYVECPVVSKKKKKRSKNMTLVSAFIIRRMGASILTLVSMSVIRLMAEEVILNVFRWPLYTGRSSFGCFSVCTNHSPLDGIRSRF